MLTIEEYQKISSRGKSILDVLAMPEGMDVCEDFDKLLERPHEVHRPFEFD